MLLAAIGPYDFPNSSFITFNIDNRNPHIPHYVSIQIKVNYEGLVIHRTVVDEGASICVMPLACCKSIISPTLILSPTMLKYFDGHTFRHHGNFPSLLVDLGGKTY